MNSIPDGTMRGLAPRQLAAELAVPSTLLQRRAARARELMQADGLDGLIVPSKGHVTQYGDVEFLTGYTPVARMSYAVLTRSGRGPVLVVPTPADRWYARRLPDAPEIRIGGQGDLLSGADDLPGGAAAVIVEEGLGEGRIGIGGLRHLLPVGEFDALRRALPQAELVDAGSLVSRLKLIKEDEDLAEVVRTVAIADAGFVAARQALRPGATDAEVGAAIRQAVFARGARDALIFVSAEAYFLSWSQGRRFRNGDLATIYVEIVGPSGYWVEVGGTVALGEPEPEALRVAAAATEAARRAEAHLRPGARAGDVARAIDAVASAARAARRAVARPRRRRRPRRPGHHRRRRHAAGGRDGHRGAPELLDRGRAPRRRAASTPTSSPRAATGGCRRCPQEVLR